MESNKKLGLPDMPRRRRIAKMKRRLHTLTVRELSRHTAYKWVREFLAITQPSDLLLRINQEGFDDPPDEEWDEDFDDEEDEEMEDGYDISDGEGPLAVQEPVIFEISMDILGMPNTKDFDAFSIQTSEPDIHIEKGMAAELVQKLKRKYRKIAADLLIANYVRHHPFLYNGFAEEIVVTQHIEGLQLFRRNLVEGIFSRHENFPEFYGTDLLQRIFPSEMPDQGKA